MAFWLEQVDASGEPIKNNIGECRYFVAYGAATDEIKKKGEIPGGTAGNVFY